MEQKNQPGNPSVAVSERMDAEKVEIKGRHGDQRVHPSLAETPAPEIRQFLHIIAAFSPRKRF